MAANKGGSGRASAGVSWTGRGTSILAANIAATGRASVAANTKGRGNTLRWMGGTMATSIGRGGAVSGPQQGWKKVTK